MKKVGIVIVSLFLILSMGNSVHAEEESVRIGIVTALSGPMEYYGVMQSRGLRLGIEYATGGSNEVLGLPIEFYEEDSQGDAGTGVQRARELIERRDVHFSRVVLTARWPWPFRMWLSSMKGFSWWPRQQLTVLQDQTGIGIHSVPPPQPHRMPSPVVFMQPGSWGMNLPSLFPTMPGGGIQLRPGVMPLKEKVGQ